MKHDDLADVKPLGVRIQISDGVHGMWMGRQLCEVRGYSAPWTNNKILDYFQDLCTFYDAWSESISHVALPDAMSELQALDLEGDTFNKWKLIRAYVEGAYSKFPNESLLSIMVALGITPTQYLQACTTGGLPKCFEATPDFISRLEEYYLSHEKIVWVEIGKEFGITAHIAKNICRVFDKRHVAKYGDLAGQRKYARELLNDLSLCTDETPTHITKEVFDRTGVRFDLSAVTKIRKRKRNTQPLEL